MAKQITTGIDHAAYYVEAFKLWGKAVTKAGTAIKLGDKPTAEQFAAVHRLGNKAGGKQSLTIAMSLREGGVTDLQIRAAASLLNAPGEPYAGSQNNKRGDLIKAGYLREVPMAPVNGVKVYACVIAPKGQAHIDNIARAEMALYGKGEVAKADQPKPVKAVEATVSGMKAAMKRPRAAKGTVKVIEATTVANAPETAPAAPLSPAMAVLNETVDYPAAIQGDHTFE